MDTIKIRVDSLAYGGNGVGRHEGIVYFIPFSVPGDLLEVRIIKKEKRYREAEIVNIIEASNDRIKPPCPHSGTCGGCQWQQVEYKKQLECKVSEFKSTLKKSGLESVTDKVLPIIPSPKKYGYRRTGRFKLRHRGADGTDIGFYRAESHNLIKIERCMLLDERINNFLPNVKLDSPELKGVDLFMDENGDVQPFYRFSERDQGADFFQVNSGVNDKLQEYISRVIRGRFENKHPRIMDLYCGDGNLSLPFADIAASITGWDSSKTAINRGRNHAERLIADNRQCKIRYFISNLSNSWKTIAGYAKQTDCVIIDPPRRGLKNQAARLAGLKIPLLIYVSCSPPDLVRDLKTLLKAGYRIEEIQPLDMFPQTYHLESVALISITKK